jgi:hypothetical protein
LGTLYAFQKAAKLALELHGLDIASDLKAGKISVGLFHTAGKGTRLAPLPGAENNNKPGVKLPATIQIGGKSVPVSILEAVIKQTGCYAKSRLSRLSVFWGDQVHIYTYVYSFTHKYLYIYKVVDTIIPESLHRTSSVLSQKHIYIYIYIYIRFLSPQFLWNILQHIMLIFYVLLGL